MKLVHPLIERVIDFHKNPVVTLVIENRVFFRNLIEELNNQLLGQEGRFILSDNLQEYPLDKKAFIVHDYFNIALESNRIKKIIEFELEEILIQSSQLEANEVLSKLERTMDLLSLEFDFPLAYKKVEPLDLVKLFKPHLEIEGNLLEKVLNTAKFMTYQGQVYVIILVNARSFLDLVEIEELIHQAKLDDLKILMLESQLSTRCKDEKVFVIDQDLCEL